ncbi:hypothetical protein I7I51_05226 [Histoplasma capsulatum]|uniref:Uncharacterized protein n=1 Tax=Ajellomyces capsulatus TaxID=5037 RepID=A0A8A1M8A0_AJECA|nr:hypothetical protein I7I51_05226 [Histoplasma capsulatum]
MHEDAQLHSEHQRLILKISHTESPGDQFTEAINIRILKPNATCLANRRKAQQQHMSPPGSEFQRPWEVANQRRGLPALPHRIHWCEDGRPKRLGRRFPTRTHRWWLFVNVVVVTPRLTSWAGKHHKTLEQ